MPRRWCWSRPETRRALSLLAALLAATCGTSAASAATMLEKSIAHRIQSDGSVLETTTLRVRLDSAADVEAWSTYPIYLDAHRTLTAIDTRATTPDGKEVVVKKKQHDTADVAGGGVLATSGSFRLVDFPRLPAGSVLTLSHTVRVEPYFPAGSIELGEEEDIASLAVEVSGPTDLRYRLDGEAEGWGPDSFRVEHRPGQVRVVGEGLPGVDPPDYAPGDAGSAPVLRYSWGGDGSWDGVAQWYQKLLDGLAASPEVSARATGLTAGLATSRERLDALYDYTAAKVRYVAVEMGIGGFLPSPPQETLTRGWGDCKDKAELLVRMLGAAGIEAYPALILSGTDERIDRELPSPLQFNHAVVAVPVAGQDLALDDGDPVADGFLFLDPTDDDGSSHWLNPSVQDQDALVVAGTGSRLVRTPRLFDRDRRELTVDLALDGQGGARGDATLELGGRYGDVFRQLLAAAPSERVEATAQRVLGGLLPGVTLSQVGWGDETGGGVPRARLTAKVELRGLVQGSGDSRSFVLPGVHGTPDLEALGERTLPVVLSPGVVRESWRLGLPAGSCAREPRDVGTDTAVGSFRQTVSAETETGREGELLTVERELELRRRWVEPDEVAALRELALEETRARKRRLRLGSCEATPGP